VFWFHYVQYDTNSILVVVPNQSLVGVCCIRSYDTISFKTTLCCFVVWNDDSDTRLQC